MINELQRQAYLDAMGIECFMPRLQLPGAKPSVLCELPEPAAAEQPCEQAVVAPQAAAEPLRSPAARQSGGAAAAIQDLLNDNTTGNRAAVASAPETARGGEKSVQAVARFSLSIVRSGPIIWVDEGLGGGTDPQEYLRLIHNIRFALGASAAQMAIDAFNWPMTRTRSAHVDQSESAARQALHAYLSKQLEQSQARYLVLLGERASQYVLGGAAEPGELKAHPGFSVPCVATQSVSRALASPELKRDIWRDLQPLRDALKPAK